MPIAKEYQLYNEFLIYFESKLSQKVNSFAGFTREEAKDILAQISVLLSTKELISQCFKALEDSLQDYAKNILKKEFSSLKEPQSWDKHLGLLWPHPTPELANQKFDGLLNSNLLNIEQINHLNLPTGNTRDKKLPAKFVSLIGPVEAAKFVLSDQIWRDEPKSFVFFHSGDMHRMQVRFVIDAIRLKLIVLPCELSIRRLLALLVAPTYLEGKNPLWLDIFDLVIIGNKPSVFKTYPLVNGKSKEQLQELLHSKNEAFFMDPFYAHNYLLNNYEDYPLLSSCLIKKYAQSAIKINEMQNAMGVTTKIENKSFISEINKNRKITIEETLNELEAYYINGDFHWLTTSVLYQYYILNGQIDQSPSKLPIDFQWNTDCNKNVYTYSSGFIFFPNLKSKRSKKPGDYKCLSVQKIEREELKMPLMTELINNNILTIDEINTKSYRKIYQIIRNCFKGDDTDKTMFFGRPLDDVELKNKSEDAILAEIKSLPKYCDFFLTEAFEPRNLITSIKK